MHTRHNFPSSAPPPPPGTSGSPISSFGSGRSRGAGRGWASFVHGRAGAPAAPPAAARLRGSAAGAGEPSPARGQRAARPARQRPRQPQPCPRPSCQPHTETGERCRAPAGAVRGLQQVRGAGRAGHGGGLEPGRDCEGWVRGSWKQLVCSIWGLCF